MPHCTSTGLRWRDSLAARISPDSQHAAHRQEGLTETRLSKEAEEIWIILQTPQQLLQMHSGEYPKKIHHSVAWELLNH